MWVFGMSDVLSFGLTGGMLLAIDPNDSLGPTFLIVGLAGLVLFIPGVILDLANHTHVQTDTGRGLTRRDRPRLGPAFTGAGIVF
jgi:hypothetical protein